MATGSTPKTWNPIGLEQYTKNQPQLNVPWIQSWTKTPIGPFPLIRSRLFLRDRCGFIKMRLGIGRMRYTVPPGLYGIGNPRNDSPVFVTANYKMTFDICRRDLAGIDGWILVLDTKGINVWCAAGKGTFGTLELIQRILITKLGQLISHRELIVPQLGAVGIAGHLIKKATGFKVTYGPVYSKDIIMFMNHGKHATPDMRHIHFNFKDRLVLTPLELFPSLKYTSLFIVLYVIQALIKQKPILDYVGLNVLGLLGVVITGTVLVPAFLPWIPGRAFSVKGGLIGFIYSLIWSACTGATLMNWIMNALFFTPIAAYLALNFTGASTYTSMSGVNKELRLSLPIIIPSLLVGLVMQWF